MRSIVIYSKRMNQKNIRAMAMIEAIKGAVKDSMVIDNNIVQLTIPGNFSRNICKRFSFWGMSVLEYMNLWFGIGLR
ncbi:MAG: hypothetical protein HQL25_05335 [Candidatus Omnitrophica bacterium]|nr:hypothetical protein [Candidatus Omnitrophota bacterium]